MASRKWLGLIVAVVVVAAGTYWIMHSRQVAANVSDGKDLIAVQRVDFPLIITLPGLSKLPAASHQSPSDPQRKAFQADAHGGGRNQVTEGDFLMEFDTSDISERLRDEIANFQSVQEERQKKRSDSDIQLKNLKLSLEQAKTDLEKLEVKLSSQVDLISGIEIEQIRIQRDAAKIKVDFLEKKVQYQTESGQLDLQISRSNESHYRNRMDDLMDAMES